MRRPAFRSLIRRRTAVFPGNGDPAVERSGAAYGWSARPNRRSRQFSQDELSDLQPRPRPVYHRKRDSVVARLTIVFAALAATRPIGARTGWSIRNSSRPPAAAAPSRSRPEGRPSPLPTSSPPTCAKPSAPSTAQLTCALEWPNSGSRLSHRHRALTGRSPRPRRVPSPPLVPPGGAEGKPIRGARPAEMIAAPHWPPLTIPLLCLELSRGSVTWAIQAVPRSGKRRCPCRREPAPAS